MPTTLTVVGIGNAIVDVLTHAEESFIIDNRLNKGAMTLIDAEQAQTLYDKMGPGVEVSGGSAANTIAGLAGLGSNVGFIGKVCDDELGRVFRHDITAAGVAYSTPPLATEPPTARCLIIVTPDAQRTMHTFLGASVELGPEDVDEKMISGAEITYLEGYLWDRPKAKEAFRTAAAIARRAGRKVALTLSDVFCVERHRDSFHDLIDSDVDILFGNEHEMQALYQTPSLEDAMATARGHCDVVAITRSEKGSVIMEGPSVFEVKAAKAERIVDSTGAGDLYASGFLYGLTRGLHLAECGRLGGLAAAEILSHFGARPESDLRTWFADRC